MLCLTDVRRKNPFTVWEFYCLPLHVFTKSRRSCKMDTRCLYFVLVSIVFFAILDVIVFCVGINDANGIPHLFKNFPSLAKFFPTLCQRSLTGAHCRISAMFPGRIVCNPSILYQKSIHNDLEELEWLHCLWAFPQAAFAVFVCWKWKNTYELEWYVWPPAVLITVGVCHCGFGSFLAIRVWRWQIPTPAVWQYFQFHESKGILSLKSMAQTLFWSWDWCDICCGLAAFYGTTWWFSVWMLVSMMYFMSFFHNFVHSCLSWMCNLKWIDL